MDLAVSNTTGLAVVLGNGDGTFSPAENFIGPVSALAMVSGDFNGDGKPDLAAIPGGSFSITIVINNTP